MDATVLDKLRAPFPPEVVGKLPRVTCGACSKNTCSEHRKSKCNICGSFVSERHIHLDYVDHADVTSRLLEADPDWTWEPLASDDHGLPLCDTDDGGRPVGMWIRLTVGGVTRLGYGSCPSSQGDAVKVLIGDALRNAAMRFGVAVDLWAKGDRADPAAENATAGAGQAAKRPARRDDEDPAKVEVLQLKREAVQVRTAAGMGADPKLIAEHFVKVTGMDVSALQTVDGLRIYLDALRADIAKSTTKQVAS
jgi:hypothetical protein